MKWNFFSGKRNLEQQEIISRLRNYDKKGDTNVIHVRLNKETILLLNQIKVATGLEIQRMVAFAVSELISQHPELQTIVKQFLQKINE